MFRMSFRNYWQLPFHCNFSEKFCGNARFQHSKLTYCLTFTFVRWMASFWHIPFNFKSKFVSRFHKTPAGKNSREFKLRNGFKTNKIISNHKAITENLTSTWPQNKNAQTPPPHPSPFAFQNDPLWSRLWLLLFLDVVDGLPPFRYLAALRERHFNFSKLMMPDAGTVLFFAIHIFCVCVCVFSAFWKSRRRVWTLLRKSLKRRWSMMLRIFNPFSNR